ncbi:MAG: hypothetical protein ABI912_10870, partial [Actinomycetota bacterium]
ADTYADVLLTDGGLRVVPPDRPEGREIAHLSDEEGAPLYTFVERPDGYLLRFHGTCEFSIALDLSRVLYAGDPGADPELIPVLVNGMLVSFLLTLAGSPVLHASAVDVGGRAIAFTGWSGMGKSTAATLVCADGGLLITDDVLRVDLDPAGPVCRLGATEARLRAKAIDLATAVGSTARTTADGRHAVAPAVSLHDRLPLGALVVPVPDPQARELILLPVQGAESLLTLARFPRIVGWTDQETNATQFRFLADVVRRVPVFIATIPWGPPFAPGLGAAIAAAAGAPIQH